MWSKTSESFVHFYKSAKDYFRLLFAFLDLAFLDLDFLDLPPF